MTLLCAVLGIPQLLLAPPDSIVDLLAVLLSTLPVATLCAIVSTQVGILGARLPRLLPNALLFLCSAGIILLLYPLILYEIAPLRVDRSSPPTRHGLIYRVEPDGWLYTDDAPATASDATAPRRIIRIREGNQPHLRIEDTLPSEAIIGQLTRYRDPKRDVERLIGDVSNLNRYMTQAFLDPDGSLRIFLFGLLLCLVGLSLGGVIRLTTWGACNIVLTLLTLRGLLWLIAIGMQAETIALSAELVPLIPAEWLPIALLAAAILPLALLGLFRPSWRLWPGEPI